RQRAASARTHPPRTTPPEPPLTAPHPPFPNLHPCCRDPLVTSLLFCDPQLRAARSRISFHFIFRSSHRTSGQNLHHFLRPTPTHRHAGRACALTFQPSQRAFDDPILERMKRDHRNARSTLEDTHRVADESIESAQLLIRRNAKGLKRERRWVDLMRPRLLHSPHDSRQLA